MHPLYRWLKWGSLTIAIGSIVMTTVLMWRAGPAEVEKVAEQEPPAKTAVESPVIVERKDGRIIWQLKADEARQQDDGRMHMIKPLLTLYTGQGKEVLVQSVEAWFEPLERNIRFDHEVEVNHEAWKMTTEQLIYNSSLDEIHVPSSFSIRGNTIRARGKNMKLQRTDDRITVSEGIWIHDSNPKWQGVTP